MRYHKYEFPNNISDEQKIENGANFYVKCTIDAHKDISCRQCSHYKFNDEKFENECLYYKKILENDTITTSISNAKKLIKRFGGSAWTYHIDRDGGIFETTEIKIKQNNSNHKYNKHL